MPFSVCNDPTPLSIKGRQDIGEGRIKSNERVAKLSRHSFSGFGLSLLMIAVRFYSKRQEQCLIRLPRAKTSIRGLCVFPVEMNCRSINVSHGVWDRGMVPSQLRVCKQVHTRDLEEVCLGLPAGQQQWQRLTSWCVGNGCLGHDCHNSLLRAFPQLLSDNFLKNH